jgi:hypothetical protein
MLAFLRYLRSSSFGVPLFFCPRVNTLKYCLISQYFTFYLFYCSQPLISRISFQRIRFVGGIV